METKRSRRELRLDVGAVGTSLPRLLTSLLPQETEEEWPVRREENQESTVAQKRGFQGSSE